MTHWAFDYLGKAYRVGTYGPDTFDCWGLVCDVYKKHLGVPLVEASVKDGYPRAVMQEVNNHPQRPFFEEVKILEEFDICFLSRGGRPFHVGIYLDVDGGGLLHADEGSGVCFHKLDKIRDHGWQITGFYRFNQKKYKEECCL